MRTVAETILLLPAVQASLAKVSQIVVKRMFDRDDVYVLQNDDRRMIDALPFHRDFTLIGTSERSFSGDPAIMSAGADDIGYLCTVASRYFRELVEPADVLHAMAGGYIGVGPDGVMNLDHKSGKAPLLTGAEVLYLMKEECARFADDILWRRSKLGLTMPLADRAALEAFMAAA